VPCNCDGLFLWTIGRLMIPKNRKLGFPGSTNEFRSSGLADGGQLAMRSSRRIPKLKSIRLRYILAFWLFILSAVAYMDRTNISIAGLAISQEYGLGNQRLGWIFSSFLIGYAVFQLPAGWLSSWFGPRRVLTIGVLLWGVTTALTAMLPTTIEHAVLLLIGMRFALGVGESVIYPSANQFVAEWVPRQERGVINGLIFAGVGAGSGLTPPMLAWLISHHGWRSAFWFSAVVGCVVGIVWWLIARDTPEEHPALQPTELQEIRKGLNFQAALTENEKPAILWRAIFHRRDLLVLMTTYFSYGYVAWIYFSWFFLYMAQVRGFDLRSSARYAMLPFLSMTVCCLAGGILSDRLTGRYGLRVGRCTLAAAAMAGTALCLIIGSQTESPQMAGLVLAGGAGVLYISQSSFWSVSADIAGDNSGIFSSMMNMGGQIGGAVTASLTPWIAQRYGWTTSFAIAAALALISAALWMTVEPERPLDGQPAN